MQPSHWQCILFLKFLIYEIIKISRITRVVPINLIIKFALEIVINRKNELKGLNFLILFKKTKVVVIFLLTFMNSKSKDLGALKFSSGNQTTGRGLG